MGNRWKWPQAIQEIYDDTVEELGGPFALERGPGYRAWGCGNLDEAEWCLEHFDEFAGDLSPEECLVVRDSLERLAAIPRRLRLPPPEHADENPSALSAHGHLDNEPEMNETNIDSQRQDKWLKELMEACAGESAACERLREAEQALEYAKEEMRSALDLAMAKTRLAEVAMLQYIKSFRVKP